MNALIGFFQATLERASKSAAQGALLAIGADKLDVFNADWHSVVGFGAGAFALSVLTSVASMPFGGTGPSLTSAETIAPELPPAAVDVTDDPELVDEEPHEAPAE